MSRILLFSRTTAYRHDSIPYAAEVIAALASADGHRTDHTEDPAHLGPRAIEAFDLLLWLSASGDVLEEDQRAAFARWLAGGGRYAGVHAATTAEPGWPEYERIAGARFTDHSEPQPATLRRTDAAHPSTAGLPASWTRTDEWYNFGRRPGADRTVLLTVDEESYDGGTMGAAHPIAWYGPYGRGHTWYTALGHADEHYDEPLVREHLRGGLRSLLDTR